MNSGVGQDNVDGQLLVHSPVLLVGVAEGQCFVRDNDSELKSGTREQR